MFRTSDRSLSCRLPAAIALTYWDRKHTAPGMADPHVEYAILASGDEHSKSRPRSAGISRLVRISLAALHLRPRPPAPQRKGSPTTPQTHRCILPTIPLK